jgi:hypothetical protein
VAATFGVLAGLGGIRHGIGEVLQGNVAPDGMLIESWTQGPLATNMGGEPGLTIVPNLLLTGILVLIVASSVIVWSVAFVQRRNGGWILLLLCAVMLLLGGGVGPPLIGMLAGVAGIQIRKSDGGWLTHFPEHWRRVLAASWPWVFGIAALNGVLLFVGSIILVYAFDVNNPDLFLNSFYLAVVSVPLATLSAVARQSLSRGLHYGGGTAAYG